MACFAQLTRCFVIHLGIFPKCITKHLASYISSKNQCITFCVVVCIAKFDILEYLKHQNAYAIMPVGRMK